MRGGLPGLCWPGSMLRSPIPRSAVVRWDQSGHESEGVHYDCTLDYYSLLASTCSLCSVFSGCQLPACHCGTRLGPYCTKYSPACWHCAHLAQSHPLCPPAATLHGDPTLGDKVILCRLGWHYTTTTTANSPHPQPHFAPEIRSFVGLPLVPVPNKCQVFAGLCDCVVASKGEEAQKTRKKQREHRPSHPRSIDHPRPRSMLCVSGCASSAGPATDSEFASRSSR